MSGARREWIASSNFVMIHFGLVDALGGSYAAAALFQRIDFRADRDGWWAATKAEMMADVHMTEWVLDRAVKELRAVGFIESERVSPYNATLRWRCLFHEDEESPFSGEGGGGNAVHENHESSLTERDESSVSLYTKNEENIKNSRPQSRDYSNRKRTPLQKHVSPPRP